MVYIHLATGYEEIEALAVCDMLRRVDEEVKLVSLTGDKTVESVHGIKVEADILFEEADYDVCTMLVLPGGLPGTEGLRQHAGLEAQIRKFAAENRPIAAICAAPTVLGDYGVLQGKKATVYPGMEDKLTGADVIDASVVCDGNLITSQGPATAVDFALAVVNFIRGEEVTAALKKKILLERRMK